MPRPSTAIEAGYRGPLYAEISPQTFPGSGPQGLAPEPAAHPPRLAPVQRHAVAPPACRGAPDGPRAGYRQWSGPLHRFERPSPGTTHRLARQAPYRADRRGQARRARPLSILGFDRGQCGTAIWCSIPTNSTSWPAASASPFRSIMPPRWCPSIRLVGEFRVHYAGFFDPGFGYEPGKPPSARAVLEVRSREVPFILEHGQIMGRLVFERLTDPPPEAYGAGPGLQLPGPGSEAFQTFPRALNSRESVADDSGMTWLIRFPLFGRKTACRYPYSWKSPNLLLKIHIALPKVQGSPATPLRLGLPPAQ